MNRPLRTGGYTFYQSSYAEDGRGGESSTFSVVRNSGRWLPYISSALLFLGLAWHFLAMLAAALKKTRPPRERSHEKKHRPGAAGLRLLAAAASARRPRPPGPVPPPGGAGAGAQKTAGHLRPQPAQAVFRAGPPWHGDGRLRLAGPGVFHPREDPGRQDIPGRSTRRAGGHRRGRRRPRPLQLQRAAPRPRPASTNWPFAMPAETAATGARRSRSPCASSTTSPPITACWTPSPSPAPRER